MAVFWVFLCFLVFTLWNQQLNAQEAQFFVFLHVVYGPEQVYKEIQWMEFWLGSERTRQNGAILFIYFSSSNCLEHLRLYLKTIKIQFNEPLIPLWANSSLWSTCENPKILCLIARSIKFGHSTKRLQQICFLSRSQNANFVKIFNFHNNLKRW